MKKTIAILLSLIMVLGMVVACTKTGTDETPAAAATTATKAPWKSFSARLRISWKAMFMKR